MEKLELEVRKAMHMEKEDAAFIVKNDGTVAVILPDHKVGDLMPTNVVIVLAIIQRLAADKEWVTELQEWFDNKIQSGALRSGDDFPKKGLH